MTDQERDEVSDIVRKMADWETKVSNNLRKIDVDKAYDEFLDECYPEVCVAGLKYTTSRVLKEIDPTAYRCGKCDFIDSQCVDGIWVEIGDEYYDSDEVEELRAELNDD